MTISVESQCEMTITIPLKHSVNLKPLCKIARGTVCGCSTIPLPLPLDTLLPHFLSAIMQI